jgi:hypothetical protein
MSATYDVIWWSAPTATVGASWHEGKGMNMARRAGATGRPARRAPIPAYRAVLSREGRRALLEAIEHLTDGALDAVVKMTNDGRAYASASHGSFLPSHDPMTPRVPTLRYTHDTPTIHPRYIHDTPTLWSSASSCFPLSPGISLQTSPSPKQSTLTSLCACRRATPPAALRWAAMDLVLELPSVCQASGRAGVLNCSSRAAMTAAFTSG